jgi:hypothetical protein
MFRYRVLRHSKSFSTLPSLMIQTRSILKTSLNNLALNIEIENKFEVIFTHFFFFK